MNQTQAFTFLNFIVSVSLTSLLGDPNLLFVFPFGNKDGTTSCFSKCFDATEEISECSHLQMFSRLQLYCKRISGLDVFLFNIVELSVHFFLGQNCFCLSSKKFSVQWTWMALGKTGLSVVFIQALNISFLFSFLFKIDWFEQHLKQQVTIFALSTVPFARLWCEYC